jgi:hypothetical protein
MKYHIQGLGFHTGFLSIDNGKRIWSNKKQIFDYIPEIPSYIMYRVYDEAGNLIIENK